MKKVKTIAAMITLIRTNPSIIAEEIELDSMVTITKEQALLETIKFMLHYQTVEDPFI